MKIKRLLSVFLLCVCLSGLLAIPAQAADAPDIRAKAALLVDVNTDAVAYAQNIHEQNYPASLTKVMTALLVLEAIESGQLTTAQAGEHHDDRHRLGAVGSAPYPPLFFRGQGAAFFLLTASKGKVYLGFRVGGDDPANSTAHDLPDGGAVKVHSPL